ncbi:MAG: HlyD family type I secretion periplasmic adaptor subunit [Alphaproteobacteria bacterium]
MRSATSTALTRGGQNRAVSTLVGTFESETAAVFAETAPRSGHLVLYALCAMVLLGVLFISVTKVDRVVSGAGRIVPTEGTLYVQPLEKAIIKDIRVKVGDIVRQGQPLATLDPTFANADLAQLEQKTASGNALVARLEAEHDGRPYIVTNGDSSELLQESAWRQRQAEYQSSLADFDARIRNSESTIAKLQQDVSTYSKRLKVASELEQMNLTLEEKGWGSKTKRLAATDSRVEIERLLAFSQNQIAETRHSLAALKAQRDVYVNQWQSNISKDLVTARDTLTQAQEDLKKAKKVSQLASLDAPTDAIVLTVGKVSIGSVAGPGGDQSAEPLFTLVPLDSPLEAEVKVDAQNIGFIQRGDPVEVKLDAYRYLVHGTAKGVVKTISEGSFTVGDDNSVQPPYFKARITITEANLRSVPSTFRLIPGMTLSGDIIVGRRTIASYLTEGVLRTGTEAMREP